ncbi:sce7726 family protein [Rhodococcus qingshengii]|uniref:sce7726 family protein n=1 Tax=Rhodococcus qingshengii TaxID=334542 RepID=UPI001E478B07|nr:sce7726 family protein [Rhodococcus qingshengii]UDF20134.1 sce7726 family protein [Rhodococcus qingshengii]
MEFRVNGSDPKLPQYGVYMRDIDVRTALHAQLAVEHADELDDTLIVDELGLCGEARVDVAVINGALSGFELKSAKDNLRRLPRQVDVYSQVLDLAVLVVAENHLADAREIIKPWWGLTVAQSSGSEVLLSVERSPRVNRSVDAMSLAQLLWREEALEELTIRDADRGVRSKPRWAVWTRLTEVVEVDELRTVVRQKLKARQSWRDC